MMVSGLVAGIVLASVTFVITWMLTYQLGAGSEATPEGEDITRLSSTSAAVALAIMAFAVGVLLGAFLGWLGHRRRWSQ